MGRRSSRCEPSDGDPRPSPVRRSPRNQRASVQDVVQERGARPGNAGRRRTDGAGDKSISDRRVGEPGGAGPITYAITGAVQAADLNGGPEWQEEWDDLISTPRRRRATRTITVAPRTEEPTVVLPTRVAPGTHRDRL